MIRVFIWLPQSKKLDDVGHASMLIKGAGYNEYCSLYPAENEESDTDGKKRRFNPKKMGKKTKFTDIFGGRRAAFMDSYEDDVKYMEREPSVTYDYKYLKEDRSLKAWNSIIESDKYNLIEDNCAAAIAQCLVAGVPKPRLIILGPSIAIVIGWGYVNALFGTAVSILDGRGFGGELHALAQITPEKLRIIGYQISQIVG